MWYVLPTFTNEVTTCTDLYLNYYFQTERETDEKRKMKNDISSQVFYKFHKLPSSSLFNNLKKSLSLVPLDRW